LPSVLNEEVTPLALSRAESFLTGPGALYLAARYGLGVFVSLGNMLVLTWWIGPHAYGVFVTAIGLVAFLASVSRGGVDTYLVRRTAIPDARTYAIAQTVVLALSVSLALAGAALVPLLTHWLRSREFVAPYLILLLSIPVIGMTGIPTAKLERELDFRLLAWIELAGQLLGLVISCALAWSGFGVWAAVAGQTVWQAFLLVAAYRSVRMLPRLAFDSGEARKMLSYGIRVTASLRTWQMRTLVNPLLVGRFVGADGVAFVALAIRIAEALGTIRQAAGRVAIASLARLQHDQERLQGALEESMYLQIIVLGPLLCVFTLFGPVIVHHVIGVRWIACLALYPFVAAGVLVNSIYNLQASALFVSGRPGVVMHAYLLHVGLLSIGTYLFVARLGIVGYGWAELLACVGYALIHWNFLGTLSYRKLLPWFALFSGVIFFPLSNGKPLRTLLLCGIIAAAGWQLIARNATPIRETCRRLCAKMIPALSSLLLLLAGLLLTLVAPTALGQEARSRLLPEQIPPTFFGMHFRLDKIDWPDLPFGTLRLWDTDTNWQRMNPQPGKYDFAILDRYLASARQNHVDDVLLTLGSTPAWASINGEDRSCDYSDFAPGSCHPPSDLNDDGTGPGRYWRDFIYNLGSHLAGLDRERFASVNHFSFWNEFTRGRESQHPSWLGSQAQLHRMVHDTACILTGRAEVPPDCTSAKMQEPAVGLLPDISIATPDAVPQAPGLDRFADYFEGITASESTTILAVHAYSYGGLGQTFPDIGRFGLVKQRADLHRVLPRNLNMPIWSTEGGWGNTQINLPDPDLQMGYIARYYLVGWSLGFRRMYWYAADNSWGRLIRQNGIEGCRDHGSHRGCPTPAAGAWTQTYRWMVGNRMTRLCAPDVSGDVWTCELQRPDGSKLLAVWDTSQTCSHGKCTTSTYNYPPEFSRYLTLQDGKSRPIVGSTLQVGWKPILLCQNCN
jgi:O-antigen/teichoic acid export membrane protein